MLKNYEKVLMFRCVQDPMIGPKPRNAFMIPDLPNWEAWFNSDNGSVYVKTDKGRRHIVPTGNLSSIELFKEADGPIQDTPNKRSEEENETKRGPGRPRQTHAVS